MAHARTAHCLHEEAGLAKHAHLGGCLSGVCARGEFCGVRKVSFSKLVIQQVARFMEGTNLPAVQVTTRRGDGVCGWDEPLKRRAAAKFAESDGGLERKGP